MEKIYFKNVIEDLKEFKKNPETDWNKANNKAAKEWNKMNPDNEKKFLKYYRISKTYIDAMAVYNITGKKLRLFSKYFKIIRSFPDVKKIIDFGCGVGSDSLQLSELGYKVIGIDVNSIASNFFKFRIKKHKSKTKFLLASKNIPKCDMVLCLDTLEHVYDPYKTIDKLVKTKPKYLLFTTAFGIHNTDKHTIPQHTDHKVNKIEKYIESKGYKKKKIKIPFPPRVFIKK